MWNIIVKPSVRLWNYRRFLTMRSPLAAGLVKSRTAKKTPARLDTLFLQVHCFEYTL